MSDFAPELWLDVLENLSQEYLKPMASTSRAFMRLTRPLLFKNITVGFCLAWGGDDNCHVAASPNDATARLQFLASPSIAPLVKSCYVGCDEIDTGKNVRAPPCLQVLNCRDAIVFFFQNIHRFTNLWWVSLQNAVVCSDTLAALRQLPSLRKICCHASNPFLPHQKNHTKGLHLPLAQYFSVGLQMSGPWLRILDPTHLRILTFTIAMEDFDFSQLIRFNLLQQLAVKIGPPHPDDVVQCELPLLTDATFPLLKDFSGPTHLVAEFLTHCPLERLSIYLLEFGLLGLIHYMMFEVWTGFQHYRGDASYLRRLKDVPPNRLANVVILDIDHILIDETELRLVLGLFENLTQLTFSNCGAWIDSEIGYFYAPASESRHISFITTALKALPRSMKALYVFSKERHAKAVKKLFRDRATINPLLVRCPQLEWIWFEEDFFALQWMRDASGRIVMKVSENPEIVAQMKEAKVHL
ncbi:hypothetical protein C8F01DRAFT_1377420 [Mycena amicta]|nr:hypothetical protein C8F01DRAFT_1377420 [Mycena amicta]